MTLGRGTTTETLQIPKKVFGMTRSFGTTTETLRYALSPIPSKMPRLFPSMRPS